MEQNLDEASSQDFSKFYRMHFNPWQRSIRKQIFDAQNKEYYERVLVKLLPRIG